MFYQFLQRLFPLPLSTVLPFGRPLGEGAEGSANHFHFLEKYLVVLFDKYGGVPCELHVYRLQ